MSDIVKRAIAFANNDHHRDPGPIFDLVAEIERLQAALVRIQNWYPISVANPRWTIKEIQEFAHATLEGKDE